MSKLEIVVSRPDLSLPISTLKKPFAVLLDVRDSEWTDSLWVSRKAAELLDAGCQYFVCFGPKSEVIHDQIDDVIVTRTDDINVITTFHDDETIEDVAAFFKLVAMKGMMHGLLIVREETNWRIYF